MKFEVNVEWGENKQKQALYKQVPVSLDQPLEQRQFEVIEKPNLRIFCSECELDLTRNVMLITKNDYYCVRCFANLEEFPQQYLVRKSLKKSFTNSSWDLMDEIVLTTAFKLWGFGNWGQIKEYLDYNCSPFPLKQIQEHFEKYYLHPNDYLPQFNQVANPKPKHTFTDMNQDNYAFLLSYSSSELKKRDSKGEKKLLPSFRSLSLISSSKDIDGQKENKDSEEIGNAEYYQNLIRKERQKRNECSILGYNIKRKQFQLGEYDYAAENMLAELQFYDKDSKEQFNLKLEIIEAYNKRLDQRIQRRKFVIEYKLLDSEYHYNHQCKFEKETLPFQPFMRFTNNHKEYRELVDNYSLTKRYEKFITNLSKMRKISKEGSLQDSYAYMKEKRKKYMERWENTYNRVYVDKKRMVLSLKKQEGSVQFTNEEGERIVPNLSVHPSEILEKALENKNQIIKISNLKVKTLFIPAYHPPAPL